MISSVGKQPLYDQMVEMLRDKIYNELQPGDALPSERELTQRYGVSRTTVRLAFNELERMGLIVRKHGKGTFVAERKNEITDLSGTYSFTEQMRELGRVPKTTILEFEEVEATKNIAAHLGLRIGERAISMKRLRAADGIPMMVEYTWVPSSVMPGLTRADLERRSLYGLMEDAYHIKIHVANEEFCASVAERADAELLGIKEGAPVLNLERTTFIDRNVIVEYTLSIARADQFRYKVSHVRS